MADLVTNPTHSISCPCFPPRPKTATAAAASGGDLITKAEKALQAFSLLGYTIDFVAAGKVIFAAVLTPGATWVTIVEAIVANIGVIFVHAPTPTPVPTPTPAQVHAVLALAA